MIARDDWRAGSIRRLDLTDHGTFGPASAILHIASKSRMVSKEFFSVPKRAISPWRVLPPSSVATPYLNANVSWPACVGERH